MSKPKLEECNTVVVAPYFEDLAASTFCQELASCITEYDRVLIVDDGSMERPFDIEDLRSMNLRGKVVRLNRNIGHQAALSCGVKAACDSWDFKQLVVMDSDGEDRPEDIQTLVESLNPLPSEESQIETPKAAVATRQSRVESAWFKTFYAIYQFFFRVLVGKNLRFGNFMALNNYAARRLVGSHDSSMHLAASLMNSRINITEVALDRGERYAGKSGMNLVTLTLHGLRSVMVFADVVLVRITLFCAAAAAFILLALFIMVVIKLMGLAISGWFSTVSGILLLLLVQVGAITLLVLLSAGNARQRITQAPSYQHLISVVEDV